MSILLTLHSTKIAFVVAHDAGFSLFRLEGGERMGTSSTPPLRFASMVGETRYMGLASLFGSGSALAGFDVAIFDAKSKEMPVSLDGVGQVRSVHFSKERMIVVCRMTTYLYDTDGFVRVATLQTALNEHGICSVGETKVCDVLAASTACMLTSPPSSRSPAAPWARCRSPI